MERKTLLELFEQQEDKLKAQLSSESKKYFLLFNVLLMFLGCIACSKDYDSLEGDNNSTKNEIVGEWIGANSKLNRHYYYLNDGNGYSEYTESDGGIFRRAFVWSLENDVLTVKYAGDDYFSGSNDSYIVSFDQEGKMMILTNVKNKWKSEYKKINDIGTTSVNYNNPPYLSYVMISGYYYELSKAVMRCYRGTGTESNFKHLVFYGANGTLKPVGVRFMYFTPYYEGIDREWHDGTYLIMKKDGYWVYGGVYICHGVSSERCDGKLTIKTSGKIKYFDFKLDDGNAIGHFEGTWSYSN